MRKSVLLSVLFVALLTFGASLVFATTTHTTSGTAGSHTPGSHAVNPGHVYASVGSGGSGSVESGGKFHDNCNPTRCFGAFAGSDWALDIGSSGNSAIRLYLGFGEYGTGYDPAPDLTKIISIIGKVSGHGNFRSDPTNRPACNWQKMDILATYYGVDGSFNYEMNMVVDECGC